MYKKVLVTLDGSRFSEAALDAAADLASGTDMQIILLTIGDPRSEFRSEVRNLEEPAPLSVDLPTAYAEPVHAPATARPIETHDQAYDRRRDEVLQYLTPHIARLRGEGLNVVADMTIGDPAERIIEYAEANDVDVIVMATHGRTGLAHLLHGSVTEKVIRSGAVPVLVVRPEMAEAPEQ